MSPLAAAWRDYREAAHAFSRPARAFLLTTFLTFAGYGVHQVLFNLYLVEAGFREAFVGRIVSISALGVVVAALPTAWLADRIGRRRTLMIGVGLDTAMMALRSLVVAPGVLYASGFLTGAGQALVAVAAAPYLSEHSTPRERTHLFSAFFAVELFAAVAGSLFGGWVPRLLLHLPHTIVPGVFGAYRTTLVCGAFFELFALLPLAALVGLREERVRRTDAPVALDTHGFLPRIVLWAFAVGAGAGLVIPFMNLYFKDRFGCSSAQIGSFFSLAQLSTAFAALLGPALARRFGRLRTAIASQMLSLPFLVTLGAERHLSIAVVSFWLRATLMQAATPLMQAFTMESLPPALRSRATSRLHMAWNTGWAVSATLAGVLIQHVGYAVPFYVTAALYGSAGAYFYLSFRHLPDTHASSESLAEAQATRPEGPAGE